MNKIDYNKKMVGKSVWVIDSPKSWMGTVENVLDEETFVVKNAIKSTIHNVNIYDVREINAQV